MTSELDEFLGTLRRIALKVIDGTLTLICALLLVCAGCVPWRLPFLGQPNGWTQSLEKFQAHCFWQFVYSLTDLLVFVIVLPSLLWPLRWSGHCKALQRTRETREHAYDGDLRWGLVQNAMESYLDVIVLPFASLLLISPWRLTHTTSVRESMARETDCLQKVSRLREWAGCAGLNGLLDWPFVAVGLLSLCMPTRWGAWLNVLVLRKGYKAIPETCSHDCEFRGYQLQLPLLALSDGFTACALLLALVNPLRLAALRRALQQRGTRHAALQWDEAPRRAICRVALTSLMDILLLPMGLLVCLSHRAGPLHSQLHHELRRNPCGYVALREEEEELPTQLQSCVLKQFGLLLLDVLTLPCLLLVLMTWYRFKVLRETMRKENAPAYHWALILNFLVVLHDLLLSLCCTALVLSVYRLPKVCRLLRESQEDLRVRIWQELGHLLLDLPLLPLLLLLILSLWRADLVLQEVWHAEDNGQRRWAVLRHFAALLRDLLGFLALGVLTVTVLRLPKVLLDLCARCARPARGVPRLALSSVQVACALGTADERLSVTAKGRQAPRQDIGAVRINVISQSFWDEISRTFGSSIASVGRALLPFTLKDGKHLNYSDLVPAEATVQLRLGGKDLKSKLMQLDPAMTMCVQIEHKAPDGTEEVLMRVPIPTQLLQEAARGNVVEVPSELLAGEVQEVCGPLVEGCSLREAMWLCAFMELWQLILDLVHLFLFLFLFLAPWRVVQCCYFLVKPSQVWQRKLRRDTLSLIYLKEGMIGLAREGLERRLDEAVKAVKDPTSRTTELCRVQSSQLSAAALPVSRVELRDDFGAAAKRQLAMQDALLSYWPGLVVGANLELAAGKLDPHEHAFTLEKIQAAQDRARQRAKGIVEQLEKSVEEQLPQKPKEPRQLLRRYALEVVKDYGTLLLAILLLLTVYRLPDLLRQLRAERRASGEQRARVVLKCQGRLFVSDLWLLLSTCLLSLLAMLTLVRCMEFLQRAWLSESLREVRSSALHALQEAAMSIYELFLLLTFWETYKTLVRACIYALLLPAWGMKPLPHWCRIAIWLGLCALPWLTEYALLCYGAMVGLFLTLHLRKGCGGDSTPGYLKTMRINGLNIWTLGSILLEPVWLYLLQLQQLEQPMLRGLSFVALSLAVLWLLVLSLPLGGRRQSMLLMLRRCMLPCMLVLMSLDMPKAVLLLGFLSFTAVLGHELLSQEICELLDLSQPPIFLSGLLYTQVVYAQLLLQRSELAASICALLAPGWVICFQLCSGPGGVGGPLWLYPLQLIAAAAPAVLSWASYLLPEYPWTGPVLAVLPLAALPLVQRWARARRAEQMRRDGLEKLLVRLKAQLGSEDPSPPAIARGLQALEAKTRMEHLSMSFLQRREVWLRELKEQSQDYAMVAQLGQELLDAIITPPSTLQIFHLMRRKSGRRVPTAIWQMILEYVSDVRSVSRLLQPVVSQFFEGRPSQQLRRAVELMREVSLRSKAVGVAKGALVSCRGDVLGCVRLVHRDGVTVRVKGQNEELQEMRFNFSSGQVQPNQDPELGHALWSVEVRNKLCDFCSCGRPVQPPQDHFSRLPCARKKFNKCCHQCRLDAASRHTAACQARHSDVAPYSVDHEFDSVTGSESR